MNSFKYYRCHLEVLEFLLKRNVQLDVQTLRGKTPLHIAVQNNFTELARLLIHHGCDVNVQVCKTLYFS